MKRSVELDELVEYWALLEDEQGLVVGKRGATRLGFALLLKFYVRHGRFPRGRGEFGDEVIAWVCCIEAKGVLATAQSSEAGSAGPLENHDKPGIRGLLHGFSAGRYGHLGWADR